MLNIDILSGPPGSGKSHRLLNDIAVRPCRHLLAVPLIDLAEEHAATLRHLNPGLQVIAAHSKAKGKGTVVDHLSRIAAEMSSEHVVAITTHETLLALDFQPFGGWHLAIDETPNALVSSTLSWPAVGHLLPEACDLVASSSAGWSRLTLRSALLAKRAGDCPISKLDPVLGRALRRRQGVLLRGRNWREMGRAREAAWISLWSFEAARPCASVTLASASFDTSLLGRALASAPPDDIRVKITTLSCQRTAQPQIRLHYFVAGHEGSTTFWDSKEGVDCLKEVADHLEHKVPDLGFWCANENVWRLLWSRAHGLRLGPRTIGTNHHQLLTSCAAIYSSKATPEDRALQALMGLSSDEIRVAREDEDIRQFVCRGAIRDPGFAGAYDIYVYSLGQAERLAAWLTRVGYADVSLDPLVEAGIMDVGRKATPPPLSAEDRLKIKQVQARERKRRQRLKSRSCDGVDQRPSEGAIDLSSRASLL